MNRLCPQCKNSLDPSAFDWFGDVCNGCGMSGKHKGMEEFIRESNYIENERSDRAFEDALQAYKWFIKKDDFNFADILEVHKILMARLNLRIAGCSRRVPVRVGNRICPKPDLIGKLMVLWLSKHRRAKTWDNIKEAHIVFEQIHPFEDGNGRVGRIILNWQRVKVGMPILVIKESEKNEYYKWFDEK